MKLKKDFILRKVANTHVVLPLGQEANSFQGLVKLNDSGAFLWNALEDGADTEALVDILLAEYAVSEEQAQVDVAAFIGVLEKCGCFEA